LRKIPILKLKRRCTKPRAGGEKQFNITEKAID